GIIDFDKDGNAILRTGEDGKTAFSSLGGNGNYFFNDSFFANGQNSNLSFLKDHFVIDGKVYKAGDASVEVAGMGALSSRSSIPLKRKVRRSISSVLSIMPP
ncbi:MAG: hypothetical protein IIX69_05210, partial [Clostridia bacterium]|nr:hypothetical protein [Clostridia bacterium]